MINNKEKKSTAPKSSDVLILFATVADTTWRLFIPTLGGVILGLWLDRSMQVRPIWTIIGVICGTMVSLVLVYLQLKGVKRK